MVPSSSRREWGALVRRELELVVLHGTAEGQLMVLQQLLLRELWLLLLLRGPGLLLVLLHPVLEHLGDEVGLLKLELGREAGQVRGLLHQRAIDEAVHGRDLVGGSPRRGLAPSCILLLLLLGLKLSSHGFSKKPVIRHHGHLCLHLRL
jgi:hypothetical protein